MRKWLAIWCMAVLPMMVVADDVKIDKENCIITKDGKTYPLYGKVEVVKSGADFKVQIVNVGADLKVELVDVGANSCGKVEVVKVGADVKVEIVEVGSDIKVEITKVGAGIK